MDKEIMRVIYDVKVCIDEIDINDSELVVENDNFEMDKIIRSKIDDAMIYLLGHADLSVITPNFFVTQDEPNGCNITKNGNVGSVELPTNYLRLCYGRFESWPYYPSEVIMWDDKAYSMLKDDYSTGTWERPKLAMVNKAGKRILELYGAKDANDKVEVALVVDEPYKVNDDGFQCLSIHEKLYRALVYYTAGLTLLTYKDEHADSLFNQAMLIAGINPNKIE